MENRKNRLYTDATSFASIVLCKYPVIFVLASQTRRRARLGYHAIVTDTEEKGKKTSVGYVAEAKRQRQQCAWRRHAFLVQWHYAYKFEDFICVNDPHLQSPYPSRSFINNALAFVRSCTPR